MIFFLNTSVVQLEAHDRAEVEELFTKLIDADKRGRHYFILSRQLAKWAIDNLTFTMRQESHLTSINQHHATRGALPKAAGSYLEICLDDIGVQIENDKVFRIGPRAFIGGEYADTKAALVIEDLITDAGLYWHLLNEARKLTNVPSFTFEPVHSGGSRALPVFKAEIEKEKVVCCLVDTDKIAPCDRKSITTNSVLNLVRKRNENPTIDELPFVGSAFCTVGHEVENYIPYYIVKDLVEQDAETLKILDRVVCQENVPVNQDCFWLFFDIKDGLCGATLASKHQNGDVTDASVQWLLEKLDIEAPQLDEIAIAGFGSGIVQKLLNCPTSLKKLHEFCRSDYWKGLFLEQFEKLLWFFAAPPRERI